MKIEKGKLYYNHQLESVIIAVEDSNDNSGILSDKIAVHCPTKEDKLFVSNIYHLTTILSNIEYIHKNKLDYILLETDDCIDRKCGIFGSCHIITIDEFKRFYPAVCDMSNKMPSNVQNEGKKESSNKLEYELDFDFITQMAERMQSNKGKYEPYNWKKSMDVEKLKQALFRHVIEVMKGNYNDDGRLHGHLEAISCNAMMINFQLKNK